MRQLRSELLLAPIKTVKSECFATQNAIVTGAGAKPALVLWSKRMDNIKLFEVDAKYVNYLTAFAPHLFHNKAAGQSNERKYLGVILTVNGTAFLLRLTEPSGSVVGYTFLLQPLDPACHSPHDRHR